MSTYKDKNPIEDKIEVSASSSNASLSADNNTSNQPNTDNTEKKDVDKNNDENKSAENKDEDKTVEDKKNEITRSSLWLALYIVPYGYLGFILKAVWDTCHKKIPFHDFAPLAKGILWFINWPVGLACTAIGDTCRGKTPFEDLGFKSKIAAWVFGFPAGLPCLAIHHIAKTEFAKSLKNKALDLASKVLDSVTNFAHSIKNFIMGDPNRSVTLQMDDVDYTPNDFSPIQHNNSEPAFEASTSDIPSNKEPQKKKSFIPQVETKTEPISRRMSI